MFGTEKNVSNFLADSSIAGIAKAADGYVLLLQPLGQELCLCALAAPVRTVEYNERAFYLILYFDQLKILSLKGSITDSRTE